MRKEYTNYSTSDLEKAEAKFEKYVKRLDKCELSGKQEEKVRNMKVECRKNFVKAKAYIIKKEFQNTIEDAGSEVKEFFQSLSDED